MADLVTLAEVKAYLEIPANEAKYDQVLGQLATRIEALLERAKHRTFAPAAAAQVITVDGTGEAWVYLDRPIAALTTVKIGIDAANPSETLTPGPTTVIAQGRRLYRQDGGLFPKGVANVQVTGSTASSLDEDAKQAVFEGIALTFRSRGSEDAISEGVGSFSHVLRKDLRELPSWKALPAKPVIS